ncbi:MAG: transglutaminase domain-containing protein, partial [Thermoplasmata archaeon]|nr:transglutaminase domain-containing protein [Thermoplasmata archaeon]
NQSGNADITITYHIRTKTIAWNLKSSDVMTVDDALDTDETFQYLTTKYNKKEWKINPTDPEIVSLANQLDVGSTIFDQAKSIFDHLEENFEYSTARGGEVKSPTETLHDENGDCDDMSFLFIAVSRAMGIPAWIELGSMYDEYNQQWVGHAWVAIYLPMTDTERSGIVNIDVVNREFLVRGANRFSDWSSDGGYTDENGNGTADDNEWHIRDYYYMYFYEPLPGTNYLSDDSTGLEYKESGSVTVRLGGEQSVPFLDLVLLIPVIIIAYTAIALKRSRQKR